MTRRLALLALVLIPVGCERYRSRAQGPFGNYRKPPPASTPALPPGTATPARSPLVINTPTNPVPPGAPDEAPLVPPRPPEPGAVSSAVTPPDVPRPPAVADSSVVQAGGVEPDAGADPDRRRPFRRNPPAATPKAPGSDAPVSPQPSSQQPAPKTPPAAAPANTSLAQAKKLVRVAAARWKGIDSYEAKLTRREVVGGNPAQTEEVMVKFRKEPMSVYMLNVGEVGRGREVLYNPTQHGDKLHVIIGKGEGKFIYKDGDRAPALSPDSPQVKSRSRHSIRDAGLGTPINRFAALVAGVEAGKLPADTLRYAGTVKRPEFGESPLEAVEQTIRPGDDPLLPTGGARQWFFDGKPGSPSQGLPVLVITFENAQPQAREVEYYCVTQFRGPANLTDADFDPARLGKKK